MNIELTAQEATFIYENIAQLNVPMGHPNAPLIASLGQSCLAKLKAGLDAETPEPLASAAKKNGQPAKA